MTYTKANPIHEVKVYFPDGEWYHTIEFPNRGEQLVKAAKFMDGYDFDNDGNIRKPHSVELITREILTHEVPKETSGRS